MRKNNRSKNAIRISVLSIAVNLLLSLLKFATGFLGHSQALKADAVHSLSDVLSTVVVIAAIVVSQKGPDHNHEYGHQRYESLASLFLALLLGFIGLKIGFDGVTSITSGAFKALPAPTVLTAVAALASVAVKEIMFRRTMAVANIEKSNALKADAWHHRSDALSSVGSLAGIMMAKFGIPVMDSIAGIIICVFIMFTAFKILLDAVKALTDASAGQELEGNIREVIAHVDGVVQIDELKTRQFGSGCYADIEIEVDGEKSLEEAHRIAEKVHDTVEQQFQEIWHCMVHVNPSL